MAEEMGVLDEERELMSRIQHLDNLRTRMEIRLNDLRSGGVPRGAKPGMGYGVGPDRPPSRYGSGGLLT